jgi:hypothetical protein
MIVLTRERIEELKTPDGGFNKETMDLICGWPLVAGWQKRCLGMKISEDDWKAAMKAKNRKRHIYRGNTRSR